MEIGFSLPIMSMGIKNCGQCDTIVLVRLEQCRDSLVVVFPETERKVHMNTLEILTLLLVVFAAMSSSTVRIWKTYLSVVELTD